jgi:cytochrome c556
VTAIWIAEGAVMDHLSRTICVAAIAAIALMAPLPSTAHDDATGVVKERMDAVKAMAKSVKAVNERIKANRGMADIKADAVALQKLAADMGALFPPGSLQHPSEARATIWDNWKDFEQKARTVETESGNLAASVEAGQWRAIAAQFRLVTQACRACHENYRAKRAAHQHM